MRAKLFKQMTICALSVALTTSMAQGVAQGIEEFTSQLAIVERNEDVEPFRYSNVTIHPDSSSLSAMALLREEIEEEGAPSTRGYRIGLFFDNRATAREAAREVMNTCDSLLSDLVATMSYDNPYFKVSVGHCTTQEEAVMMLHRVQRIFPRAFLMRESVTPADMVKAREAELISRQKAEEERLKLDSLSTL